MHDACNTDMHAKQQVNGGNMIDIIDRYHSIATGLEPMPPYDPVHIHISSFRYVADTTICRNIKGCHESFLQFTIRMRSRDSVYCCLKKVEADLKQWAGKAC